MGERGPRKKPTALRLLAGNPGKRPLNRNEPKPAPIAPKCPSWLDKEAKRKWKELAPKLEKLGLLTEVDGETLAALCMHWSLMKQAAARLKEEGLVTVDERGLPRKHPLLQVLRDNSTAFKAYAARFGLTPADRADLSLPEKKEEDEFEEFLRRGKTAKKPASG